MSKKDPIEVSRKLRNESFELERQYVRCRSALGFNGPLMLRIENGLLTPSERRTNPLAAQAARILKEILQNNYQLALLGRVTAR